MCEARREERQEQWTCRKVRHVAVAWRAKNAIVLDDGESCDLLATLPASKRHEGASRVDGLVQSSVPSGRARWVAGVTSRMAQQDRARRMRCLKAPIAACRITM